AFVLGGRRPLGESFHHLIRYLTGANQHCVLFLGLTFECAGLQHLPIFDKGYPVARNLYLTQQLRIEQDGCPPIALGFNEGPHHWPAKGKEVRGWFLEEKPFRAVEQSLRQADTLHRSLGDLLQALVTMRRETRQVEECWNPLPQHPLRHAIKTAV